MKPAFTCLPHPGTDPGTATQGFWDLPTEPYPKPLPAQVRPPDLDPRASAPLATCTSVWSPPPSSCRWAPLANIPQSCPDPAQGATPGGNHGVMLWPLVCSRHRATSREIGPLPRNVWAGETTGPSTLPAWRGSCPQLPRPSFSLTPAGTTPSSIPSLCRSLSLIPAPSGLRGCSEDLPQENA